MRGLKSYNLDYKASLNWTVNDDNFLYGFIATGYKPGGLNVPVGFGPPCRSVRRRVMNYEAAGRRRFFDGHLRTTDRRLLQQLQQLPGHDRLSALSDVRLRGQRSQSRRRSMASKAEAQACSEPCRSTRGIGLMHSSLGHSMPRTPRFASVRCLQSGDRPRELPPASTSADTRQTYAPNFTFNFGAQYEFQTRRRRHADAAGELRACVRAVGDAVRQSRAGRQLGAATFWTRSSPGRTETMS